MKNRYKHVSDDETKTKNEWNSLSIRPGSSDGGHQLISMQLRISISKNEKHWKIDECFGVLFSVCVVFGHAFSIRLSMHCDNIDFVFWTRLTHTNLIDGKRSCSPKECCNTHVFAKMIRFRIWLTLDMQFSMSWNWDYFSRQNTTQKIFIFKKKYFTKTQHQY